MYYQKVVKYNQPQPRYNQLTTDLQPIYNQLTTSIQPRYNYLEALHNHCTTRAAR